MEKGNKHDPFLFETYRSKSISNDWFGGWVHRDPPLNDTVFIDWDGVNRGTSIGTRTNPFSSTTFNLIKYYDIWTCGWVDFGSADGLKFVTQGMSYYGDILVDGEIKELGSRENPFTHGVYQEMEHDDIWSGGWVKIDPITPVYIGQSNSGNESGSGSGCGCGSGSGSSSIGMHLQAGSEWVTDANVNITGHPGTNPELLISWGDGTFGTSNEPSVSAQITDIGNSSENAISINASWSQPFVVLINDSRLSSIITYSIPLHYRN